MPGDPHETRKCPACNASLKTQGSVLRGRANGPGSSPVPGRYDAWGHFNPVHQPLRPPKSEPPVDTCAACGHEICAAV